MNINLFYLSGNTTGGWVTYTAHLMYGLKQAGYNPLLYKVGNRSEMKRRQFGYDQEYRNICLGDAEHIVRTGGLMVPDNPNCNSVIVALQKNFREKAQALLEHGAWMVVHDPAEFANLKLSDSNRYITIRKAVQKQIPDSHLVLHPYHRHFKPKTKATGELNACSISRIDFDKHTDILLDANRLLPKDKQIQINGFENRLYTRFKICPNYPEWEQSKAAYPREREVATSICHKATYAVDMSVIKGDGGGTQYSFMEAMDAGSINIINRKWLIPGDEMKVGVNCFAVSDGEELAAILKKSLKGQDVMVKNSDILLARHDAKLIAKQFVEVLNAKA